MSHRLMVAAALALALSSACSTGSGGSASASPALTPQAECERNGGWWHANGNFCEYQAPGGPETPKR